MGYFVADQNKKAFFYESGTYANTSGAGQWMGQVTNHEADESMGVISQRYVGQGNRNVGMFLDGPITFNNTLAFNVQDWKFMKFVLGSCVDGGSPSPYQHNIAETNNDCETLEIPNQSLPSFGFEDAQTFITGSNFVRTFKGCIVDTATISAKEREPITCELAYGAKTVTYTSGAATSVTADATRPFMWRDTIVMIESGTTLPAVKECTVEVANNLDQPHYVDGDRYIGLPLPTMRDYTVTLVLNASTNNPTINTLYDQYFLGGSTFNMLVDMRISTGSEQAIWTFSGCKMEDMTAPSPNEGVNEQTLVIRPQTSSMTVFDTTQYYNAFSGGGF